MKLLFMAAMVFSLNSHAQFFESEGEDRYIADIVRTAMENLGEFGVFDQNINLATESKRHNKIFNNKIEITNEEYTTTIKFTSDYKRTDSRSRFRNIDIKDKKWRNICHFKYNYTTSKTTFELIIISRKEKRKTKCLNDSISKLDKLSGNWSYN